MAAKLTIEVVAPTRTGVELWRSRLNFGSHPGLQQIERMFGEIVSGSMPAVVRVTADDSTGVAASQTVVCVFASLTGGDTVSIITPEGRAITYTGQTAAVTLGDPTFRIITSNALTGTSLAAQINADPRAKGVFTASGTSTVTITMVQKGTVGNAWGLKKGASNGSASAFTLGGASFAGGKDAGQCQSVTATFSAAATADDTVIIGGVTFTGKASPSGESQFAVGADETATAANLAAKVNAHSKCQGLMLASSAAGVMTVALQIAGRWGTLVTTGGSCSVLTWSATTFAPSTTEAYAADLVTYKIGATAV